MTRTIIVEVIVALATKTEVVMKVAMEVAMEDQAITEEVDINMAVGTDKVVVTMTAMDVSHLVIIISYFNVFL